MSFGFGVGDFIAGANLAYKLIQLMTQTQGATKEFQEALAEVCGIQQIFIQLTQLCRSESLPQATLNSMAHIIIPSMTIIADFLNKIKSYQEKLAASNGISTTWCRMGWALCKSDELKLLRDTLHSRLTSINTLLMASNHLLPSPGNVARYQVESEDQETRENAANNFESISTMLSEKKQSLCSEGRSRCKSCGRKKAAEEAEWKQQIEEIIRIQANIDAKRKTDEARIEEEKNSSIKFKDAVGRKFSFPYNICRTWEGMEELIKEAFVHVDIIGPHVQAGHYDLIGPNGEIILPKIWEEVVKPNWAITMHMWPMERPRPAPQPPPSTLPPDSSYTSEVQDEGNQLEDKLGKKFSLKNYFHKTVKRIHGQRFSDKNEVGRDSESN
ncbi:hypothetical protein F5Y02DRAFT_416843 [Annulohypoxylon stygium]|nr:hypothetical protein F5Y02DRAFT_416843 [Annulohypoxylon stygium]